MSNYVKWLLLNGRHLQSRNEPPGLNTAKSPLGASFIDPLPPLHRNGLIHRVQSIRRPCIQPGNRRINTGPGIRYQSTVDCHQLPPCLRCIVLSARHLATCRKSDERGICVCHCRFHLLTYRAGLSDGPSDICECGGWFMDVRHFDGHHSDCDRWSARLVPFRRMGKYPVYWHTFFVLHG
ncbi:hypothetical protein PITC_059980 [Penicillium italicum]|uniref:Uncharacterized protein n=1 Tax=Penicillium italicum TaxID=40296 RepID=A0A0A2LED5_PENIT|nr:hypothetical protein PITC_059980 [Penicillium italicum]